MNILIEDLPQFIEIHDQEYPINCDFKTCLKIILAFEDEELTSYEKQIVMLECLYQETPENTQLAIDNAVWFLNGGQDAGEDEGDGEYSPRLYSFSKDANFIYAAFRQTHNIDLHKETLHWWQFLALFMDLGADTTFSNLVSLRKRVKNGKATKEEIKAALKMGDLFDVPEVDTRTLDEREKESEFMRLVNAKI